MYRNTTNSTYGSQYSNLRGYSVHPRTSAIINTKPIGLYNLTNTCYISAVLQNLFLILPDSLNRGRGKVTQLFFKLKASRDTKDYKSFKIQVERFIQIVRGFQQQDAQQFLIKFLELLSRQNTQLQKKSPANLDYNQRLSIAQNHKIFISEMRHLQISPIIDLFSGELVRQFKCEKDHTKHKFQRYQCLSLSFPIPTSKFSFSYSSSQSEITLKQMIQKQLEGERIQDLMCQKCKRNTNFTKYTYLYTLPTYLILHLARFKQGYTNNQKITTNVEFNQQLLIQQACDKATVKYKLIGIINHFGTLNRGHYYAQVKNSDGNWYQINDQTVRPLRIQKQGNKSKYVYILFYQRFK